MERMTWEIPSGIPGRSEPLKPITDEEFEILLNREPGDLGGYDCPICKNRGHIYHVGGGEISCEPCKCRKIRAGLKRLEKSGLSEAAKQCTFDRFKTDEPWQKLMKDTAKKFVGDRNRQWLFVSGQSGCGKSHICTAVTVKFIMAGAETRYVRWMEAYQELQAAVFDAEAYSAKITPLKRAKVLYIDDLFKNIGNCDPDKKEFRLAMEILNARYNNPKLITILSTELSLRRLNQIDAAFAGRIAERSEGYRVQIAVKPGRNYREKFLQDEKFKNEEV